MYSCRNWKQSNQTARSYGVEFDTVIVAQEWIKEILSSKEDGGRGERDATSYLLRVHEFSNVIM